MRATRTTSRAASTRTHSTRSIAGWTATLPADPLLDVLERHGVPAGRIFRAPEMLMDPHFRARDAIVDVAHPVFERLKMQNVFPKLSRTQGAVRWPGPELGAHNAEVYRGLLGLSDEELAALEAAGIA